jgi:Fic family protein
MDYDTIMTYLTASQLAKKWTLSERSIRNYCTQGRIPGAFLKGKAWMIPDTATPPIRKNQSAHKESALLMVLRREKKSHLKGGIYHRLQIEMTYNSNHIEGSRLTQDQTRYIFETHTLGISETPANVDDIIETVNHFRCIDLILDEACRPLTESLIKKIHFLLKSGTSDSQKEWFAIGDNKKIPNEVSETETVLPEKVPEAMQALLTWYHSLKNVTFADLLEFHYRFETIHPFQDGNGRVGRLILLKECLSHNITPFIITDDRKFYYYRGLKKWKHQPGYLKDTCLACQDDFKKELTYFRIPYPD